MNLTIEYVNTIVKQVTDRLTETGITADSPGKGPSPKFPFSTYVHDGQLWCELGEIDCDPSFWWLFT